MINLPDSSQLPDLSRLNDSFLVESNRESEVPYTVVANVAFPLTMYCMKPYSSQKLPDSKWIFGHRSFDVLQKMLLVFYQTGFEFYLQACIYNLKMQQK